VPAHSRSADTRSCDATGRSGVGRLRFAAAGSTDRRCLTSREDQGQGNGRTLMAILKRERDPALTA
jgi:hypothetical protein